MPYTLEQIKKLQRGDTVFLTKWKNKKDKTRSITSEQNAIVVDHGPFRMTFHTEAQQPKTADYAEYGTTWTLEPPKAPELN